MPGAVGVKAHKPFKHAVALSDWDARAIVADLQVCVVGVGADHDGHLAACVAGGVVGQISQHPCQP
ncbi:Uncharacterised protein [Mycobacteroides abscessus subsp. abscessus]|nr:Uncharacterised protein [Mycobacteroides abscessus subsp. abscessus]